MPPEDWGRTLRAIEREVARWRAHRKPRRKQSRVDLTNVLDSNILDPITAAKKISFHAVGDTGAAKVNSFQSATRALANEASVADAMARDVQAAGAACP